MRKLASMVKQGQASSVHHGLRLLHKNRKSVQYFKRVYYIHITDEKFKRVSKKPMKQ